MDDLNKQKKLYKGEQIILDDEWQEDYMGRLADFMIKMLDSANNIP